MGIRQGVFCKSRLAGLFVNWTEMLLHLIKSNRCGPVRARRQRASASQARLERLQSLHRVGKE